MVVVVVCRIGVVAGYSGGLTRESYEGSEWAGDAE